MDKKFTEKPATSSGSAGMPCYLVRFYWKLRIFWMAMRWIPQINLGNQVYYEGSKYTVCNGNRCNSWRLGDLDNGCDGWVRRSGCRKVWTWKNMKHSFYYGWNFYMTNWYDIWCRSGIKDWMRGCNIWPWPFNR